MNEYEETAFYLNTIFWVVYLLFTVILVFASRKIAQSKGRDPTGWGIFTFFCGLLPIVILAFMSDISYEVSDRSRRSGARRRQLDSWAPPAQSYSSRGGTSETKRCPFCAESIQVQAIVCRYCDRDLSPNQYCALSTCNNVIGPELSFTADNGEPVCSQGHVEMVNRESSGSFVCAYADCGVVLTTKMAETFKTGDGKRFCSSYHRRIANYARNRNPRGRI